MTAALAATSGSLSYVNSRIMEIVGHNDYAWYLARLVYMYATPGKSGSSAEDSMTVCKLGAPGRVNHSVSPCQCGVLNLT